MSCLSGAFEGTKRGSRACRKNEAYKFWGVLEQTMSGMKLSDIKNQENIFLFSIKMSSFIIN